MGIAIFQVFDAFIKPSVPSDTAKKTHLGFPFSKYINGLSRFPMTLSIPSSHIKEQPLIQKQPSKSEGCFCIYARKA